MQLGPVPAEIKGVQHFMKLAEDHDERNVVVSYYARMAAIQLAMKIVPGSKPPEVGTFLLAVMDWLETAKQENADVDGIGNETVAQALIEEYMLKLYEFAYNSDCTAKFHKNMVKAYYTSSLLCEVLNQFGPLSEDITTKCKTAKYRAAYIHNMLKSGQEPTPINVTVVENEDEENEYALSKEELNRRRALRGEPPINDDKPEMDPDEFAAHRKEIDEMRKNRTDDYENNLKKIKERIDADESHNNDDDDDIFAEPFPTEPTTPDRIIDVGPAVYPEPRLPPIDSNSISNDLPAVPTTSQVNPSSIFTANSVAALAPAQNEMAMKYCKWASSALNYDDIKTAAENLEKALYLCRYGKEKP